MKTAQKIKERHQRTESEIIRISNFIGDNPSLEHERYDRTELLGEHSWTWKEALIAHVSERLTLEWVLKN
jgi:hypothetical protein